MFTEYWLQFGTSLHRVKQQQNLQQDGWIRRWLTVHLEITQALSRCKIGPLRDDAIISLKSYTSDTGSWLKPYILTANLPPITIYDGFLQPRMLWSLQKYNSCVQCCIPALFVQDVSSVFFNFQKYTSFASSWLLLKKHTFSIDPSPKWRPKIQIR